MNAEQLERPLNEALRRYARQDSVTGIDVGYKYVDGSRTDVPVIRLHVTNKKPLSELNAAEVFPSNILGAPTDVIEATYLPHATYRNRRLDPIQPGISVSREGGSFGTIGAIVYDKDTDDTYILSNWHVLAGEQVLLGHPIVQPGALDGGGNPTDQIATLSRFILDSDGDAAIAKISGSRGIAFSQFESEITLTGTRPPETGEILEKSGIATGITQARVDGQGQYFMPYPSGRIGINGFRLVPIVDGNPTNLEISKTGDSGSVWYSPRNDVGVGLHVAGESDPSPRTEHAIACYLPNVLSRLNVVTNPAERISTGRRGAGFGDATFALTNLRLPEDASMAMELPENFTTLVEEGKITGDVLEAIQNNIAENTNLANVFVAPLDVPDSIPEAAEYTHNLGTHNLPNNTRLHKHGTFDYRFETRSVKWQVYVTFKHPQMSDFVNDAITCTGAAAIGSVIAAVVFESPRVGLAIFKPAWQACMVAKIGQRALEISVELGKRKIHGSWSGH